MLLYVMLLENEKFFLYPSEKSDMSGLFLEASLLNNYVKVNPPILILETYYIWDIKEVDTYVKKYMLENGIENVRGGSYSDTILPEYKILSLNSEFSLSKLIMIDQSNMVDRIIEKYKDSTNEECVYEILRLHKKLDEYKKIKSTLEHYSTLDKNDNTVKLDRSFNFILTWLIQNMNNINILHCDIENLKEFRSFYNNSMKKLQQLSRLFFERFPNYEFLPTLHFIRPDVVFDRIFIHKQDGHRLENIANEVYNKFEFMYHKMINYLDELEFDLSTFPENFEKETEITICYLTT